MRKCRYLVSFRQGERRPKRDPVVKLSLSEGRKDLTLLAPSSFEARRKAPTAREQDEALFLLPRFGRGIAAEAALWPYRPSAKRGRWKATVVARIERTDDVPWPEELTEIAVHVLVHKVSKVYGRYGVRLAGEDLASLREAGQERLLLFEIDEIPAGEVTVDVTAIGNAEGVSANVRKALVVHGPPAAGQAGPWVLSDRFARVGGRLIRAPSLDDAFTAGEPASVMAYGCRRERDDGSSWVGRLVPLARGAEVPLQVQWLDATAPPPRGCGWLVGEIAAPLEPGRWAFVPPPGLAGEEDAAPVEFSVRSPGPADEPVSSADIDSIQGP
jgi:hypothetical protein